MYMYSTYLFSIHCRYLPYPELNCATVVAAEPADLVQKLLARLARKKYLMKKNIWCSSTWCVSACPRRRTRSSWRWWRSCTWCSSWAAWSPPPRRPPGRCGESGYFPIHVKYFCHLCPNTFLWNPMRTLSFMFGLWGICKTTNPARRSNAMLAISETCLSPECLG